MIYYLKYLADTEISYLHCSITSNQEIIRFYIPMYYILFSQMKGNIKKHIKQSIYASITIKEDMQLEEMNKNICIWEKF